MDVDTSVLAAEGCLVWLALAADEPIELDDVRMPFAQMEQALRLLR
jgi:hypothetical protein